MKTSRTPAQTQLNQLVMDFYSLVEAGATPAAQAAGATGPTAGVAAELSAAVGAEVRRGVLVSAEPPSALPAKEERFDTILSQVGAPDDLTVQPVEEMVEHFLSDKGVLEARDEFENLMLDSLAGDPVAEADPFGADDPDEDEEAAPAAASAEEDALAALYDQYPPAEAVKAKPVTKLTAEDLLLPDENGEPALFAVIYDGRLDELAPGVITEEACLAQDTFGNTAAHLVARYCETIPEPFQAVLTERTLSVPDQNGRTAAHEFAKAGLINQLPETALTAGVLMTPDDDGLTAAEYAAESGEPCRVVIDTFGTPPMLMSRAAQLQSAQPSQSRSFAHEVGF
jgi:hypothetical protein